MILIADSGSTKTAWRLVDENNDIHQFRTEGMNPVHMTSELLEEILLTQLCREMKYDPSRIDNVYFYGAGCVPGKAQEHMHSVLHKVFKGAEVFVEDDMLAAARAVCGHNPGIACILGTGSNSCFYDGEQIEHKVPALGFILGDEGSGSWMGKSFLASYIRNELPEELRDRFQKQYSLDRQAILQNVYRGERPASYLAGFSKFLFRHRSDPFVHQLVYSGFTLFLEKNVMRYEDYSRFPVHFSGSIAFYYSSILRQAASGLNLTVKNIVESPIAGLTLYHNQQNK
jgi:N-acetylglucosamine kinase-like BadF-type ATPase